MFQEVFSFGMAITISFVLALSVVFFFHLTSFHLFDRASSTASGLQEITIACDQNSSISVLPEKIANTEQLSQWHCRHIMLEEIGSEQAAGKFISTVYRDDPNVAIRKEIYVKVKEQIMNHPVSGIGWGSIASILGTDERGAGLNASNMFLEIWLGSGIIGLLAFVVFWFGTAIMALRKFFQSVGTERFFLLFFLSSWVGITVFDMFNSGILLGFFFLYLALGTLILEKNQKKL
jgi:hypothetical protein